MLKKSERLTEFFVTLTKSKSQADSFLTLNKNYVVKQSLFLRCTNISVSKRKRQRSFFLTLEKLPAWLTLMCCDVNKSQINQFIFQPMPEEKEIFLHKCLMA